MWAKKGVVRDPLVHKQVIHKILDLCAEIGLKVNGLTYSPIKGPEGNIEYLLWASKHLPPITVDVARDRGAGAHKAGLVCYQQMEVSAW